MADLKKIHTAGPTGLQEPGELDALRCEAARLRAEVERLHNLANAHTPDIFEAEKADLERAETLAGLGSWSRDLETGLTHWSPGILKMFGVDPDGPTPDVGTMAAMVHPDDRDRVQRAVDASIASGKQVRLVYRLHGPKGERAIESLIQLYSKERRVVGTVLDVTATIDAASEMVDSEHRLRTIVEHLNEGLLLMDAEGTILMANPASEHLLATPSAELVGRTITGPEWGLCRLDGSPMPEDEQPVGHVVATGQALYGVVGGIRLHTGELRWIRCSACPLTEHGDRLTRILCTFSDFTLHVVAQEALRAGEARLNEAQRMTRFGTWETDLATGSTTWSAGLYRLLDRDPADGPLEPEKFLDCVHEEDRAAVWTAFDTAESSGRSFEIEFRFAKSETETVTLHATAHVYCHESKPVRILGNVQDVTEQKAAQSQIEWQMRTISSYAAELEAGKRELEKANARLEALATTDGLTGLMNHRAFQERMDHEFKRARRYNTSLSLLLIDVDQFKSYNDSFGHQAGDSVLRAVAETLLSAGRETDSIARYGGEEFVAILPDTAMNPALDAAERFRVAINSRALGSRKLSISVGVATLSPLHVKASELVTDSDRALYFAKSNGRNRVAWVSPSTGKPMVGR